MANITLFGASYTDVPACTLPKTGGGTVRFTDTSPTTATDSDVASGKVYFKSDGSQSTGTASGGGTDFIVTLTWDSQTEIWTPNKTFAEIVDAETHGLTTCVCADDGSYAYCVYDSEAPTFYYGVASGVDDVMRIDEYEYNGNGIDHFGPYYLILPVFDTPSKTYTPTESQQTDTIGYDPNDGFNGIEEVGVTINAIPSNYVGSSIPRRDWTDVTFDLGDSSVDVPAGYYAAAAGRAMPTGTVNNPTATKGGVSNHSVSVTPSVSFSAGCIGSGTKSGTAVSVSASELVSGSQTITSNNTYDVTNLASVVVNVSGGGVSGVAKGTLTVASNVNTSTSTKITDTTTIGFTPKAFLFYRSDRSATNNHVNVATFVTLGSSYYVRSRTRYSSNALSTSGDTNNWTTQTSGYLYFNSNTVYFRSSSSNILAQGTWNWVAIQ